MVQCFIERMGNYAGCSGTNIEFADIDGVKHIIPGFGTDGADLVFGDGIVVQFKFRDVLLVVIHHVFDQSVIGMGRVRHEEYIITSIRHFAEYGYCCRHITIADVILAAIGYISAVLFGGQSHFAGINVSTMLFFRQSKSAKSVFFHLCYCPVFYILIVSHKDRIQSQCGNMVGIPVGSAVKSCYFGVFIHPVGTVILVRVITIAFGQEQSLKMSFFGDKLLIILGELFVVEGLFDSR